MKHNFPSWLIPNISLAGWISCSALYCLHWSSLSQCDGQERKVCWAAAGCNFIVLAASRHLTAVCPDWFHQTPAAPGKAGGTAGLQGGHVTLILPGTGGYKEWGGVATIFWYFSKFRFVYLLLKVFFLVKNIYWAIDLVLVFALESWARWAVRWQNTQQTSNNYNYNTVSRHRHADIAPPLLSPHYTLILRLSLPLTRSGFFVVRLTSKNLNISMRFKVFKSKY